MGTTPKRVPLPPPLPKQKSRFLKDKREYVFLCMLFTKNSDGCWWQKTALG